MYLRKLRYNTSTSCSWVKINNIHNRDVQFHHRETLMHVVVVGWLEVVSKYPVGEVADGGDWWKLCDVAVIVSVSSSSVNVDRHRRRPGDDLRHTRHIHTVIKCNVSTCR